MTWPLGINEKIFCDTSTSYFFSIFIWSADYFLSYVHPKGNHPWLSKNVGVCVGKRPYAWEKNRAIFWEPSIPKMLKVESLQPPGHDIGQFLNNLSNEWPSNLPFTEKVVGFTNYSWGSAHAFRLFSGVHPAEPYMGYGSENEPCDAPLPAYNGLAQPEFPLAHYASLLTTPTPTLQADMYNAFWGIWIRIVIDSRNQPMQLICSRLVNAFPRKSWAEANLKNLPSFNLVTQ